MDQKALQQSIHKGFTGSAGEIAGLTAVFGALISALHRSGAMDKSHFVHALEGFRSDLREGERQSDKGQMIERFVDVFGPAKAPPKAECGNAAPSGPSPCAGDAADDRDGAPQAEVG